MIIKFPKKKAPRPILVSEADAKARAEGFATGLMQLAKEGFKPIPAVAAIFGDD